MGADRARRRARRRGRGDRAGLRAGRDRAGGVRLAAAGRVGRARRSSASTASTRTSEEPIELHRIDPEAERRQLERTRARARGAQRRRGRARARARARGGARRPRTCCRRCATRCARAARSARSATCCATSGACTTGSARRRERRARVPPRDECRGGRHGRGRGAHARDAAARLQGLRRRGARCRSRLRSPGRCSRTAPASSLAGAARLRRRHDPLARLLERRRAVSRRGVRRAADGLYSFDALSRDARPHWRRRCASGSAGARERHVRRPDRDSRANRLEVHGARLPARVVGRGHDAREPARARGRRRPAPRLYTAFVDPELNDALGVDGVHEYALALLALGTHGA